MKLEERLMSVQEMADWFGIGKEYYYRNTNKKLKELEQYCEFERIPRKGVLIKHIYDPDFVEYNPARMTNYNIVKEEFPKQWNKNGIDQCSNVAVKIQEARSDLNTKETTTYNYTLKAKKEYVREGRYIQRGWLGKKIGKNGSATFEAFTEEEQKVVDKIARQMFGEHSLKDLLVLDMHEKGEIGSDEAIRILKEVRKYSGNSWLRFISLIHTELKLPKEIKVVRATDLEENAFGCQIKIEEFNF